MRAFGIGIDRKISSVVLVSLLVGIGGIATPALAKDKEKAKAKATEYEFNPVPFVTRVKGADETDRSKVVDPEIQKEVDNIQVIPENVNNPEIDDLKSRDPNFYLKRAKVFVKHKMYRRALIDLNKCLKLNPSSWEGKYVGAYIYQMQGRTEEAIERYRELIKVKPNNVLAHVNLGSLLRSRHQYDLAEKHYKKAVAINYYSLRAHYNLANVLTDQHRLEEALKELKICVKLKPNNAWVHNNLGVLYQRINYHEEAEEEFLKAITLEPANKKFVTNLKLLRANKDTYQAQADAADLL